MCIEHIFQAAGFLWYEATEQKLVDRMVMNFHPGILSQAALLDRPRSLKELYRVVAVIEQKCSVARERQRVERDFPSASGAGVGPRDASRVASGKPELFAGACAKCWGCGHPGYFKRSCPGKSVSPRSGQSPGRRQAPGAKVLSGLRKVTVVSPDAPLWVMLELQVSKVPAW